ncbi:MAG: DUF5662 family protein [Roseburia sp.]
MKAWKHFCTVTYHKKLVLKGCMQVGLYWQGLLHDLSKYSPTEFLMGCRYYQGDMSPNNAEREERGYSSAWLHHKGRNKHHMEYWIDYATPERRGGKIEHKAMCGMKMPIRYVVEMYVDRVAAAKVYQKERYTDKSALIYYRNGKQFHVLHEDSAALLELLLVKLAREGETVTNLFIRQELLKGKVPYRKDVLEGLLTAEIEKGV